ncbi:hypothetical protein V2J09_021133 [Rumex salicifolius]
MAFESSFRPLAGFPEDIWGDRFLEHNVDPLRKEAYAKEIDWLKERVRGMLLDDSVDQNQKLDWIYTLDRLGISYYFEKEIDDQLGCIFEAYNYQDDHDLYTVGLHFLVFRQHGYKLLSDVFNKFKDNEGKLKESLKVDVKGILSLYEAANLRMHNEPFLDEALDLSMSILKSVASQSNLEDQSLYKKVVQATKQAFHTGIRRVETRHFISFYEEDESRNETLLRLAKLNFNMLQLLHREEWWKELDVKTQLPYARDRSLECHFWAVGMYFEGHYSRARLLMTRVYLMLSILDDTYDAYGTFDELRLLTQAFERWDKSLASELPGKMKLLFDYVFNVYDVFEKEMEREGREHVARYAKARLLDLIRSYFMEVNWAHQKHVPRFEEYMINGRITSVAQIVTTSAMIGMEPEITNEKAFEWVINPVPRAIRGAEVVSRLMDDIVTHQEEQQRGLHVASGVECYMNEHGVNRDEAVRAIREVIRDGWKDINGDLIKPIPVSPRVLNLPINLARLRDALYKEIDGYTYSAKVMKDEALWVYDEAFDA